MNFIFLTLIKVRTQWVPCKVNVTSFGRHLLCTAGRGSSIGCASADYADGLGSDPHIRQNILSWRFGHEKKIYGHSLPSTDSRREVVSYWRNNVH